jgi:hypothetical protein
VNPERVNDEKNPQGSSNGGMRIAGDLQRGESWRFSGNEFFLTSGSRKKNLKKISTGSCFFPSGRSKIMDEKKITSGRFDLAIRFFPEKYFTIYLSERTEFFSHMTARPLDPESRRRPLYAAVTLVLAMAAVLLAAGCTGPDYVPNSDIVIVKLSSNGILEWYKVIDSGENDQTDSITPVSDGGFIISAQIPDKSRPGRGDQYLMKFSSTGDNLWNRSVYELDCGSSGLKETHQKKIITISGKKFCLFSSDGELIMNRTINPVAGNPAIETMDGGFLIGGHDSGIVPYTREEFLSSGRNSSSWDQLCGNTTPPENPYCGGFYVKDNTVITKLDNSGDVLWQHSLRLHGTVYSIIPIIEMQNETGYMVLVRSSPQTWYSIHLEKNGTLRKTTQLDIPQSSLTPPMIENLSKYSIVSVFPVQVVFFDSQWKAIGIQPLNPTSIVVGQTDDAGYVSAGFFVSPDSMSDRLIDAGKPGGLNVVKFHPDGSTDWVKAVPEVSVNNVKQIVQISDGGYIILCENDKGRH